MRSYFFIHLVGAIAAAMLWSACGKTEQAQFDADKKIIVDYIKSHNITDVISTETGLSYKITQAGSTTEHPTSASTVQCYYKGYLTDGTVFDAADRNAGAAPAFPLTSVIKGWTEGIPKLTRNGGKGTFFIPSKLGYQTQATGSIPANSVLIFEVELVDFVN